MDSVEVSTTVYLSPEEVHQFLVDFPRYAEYSKHLTDVRQYGDGTPGTEYELDFAWWKLSYTARSRVTGVENPHCIDWRVVKDVDAVGRWDVERLDDETTRVTLVVEYAPDSADDDGLGLPRFVSLDWVVEKVEPKVRAEAERVVRRIVADLEGEPREVVVDIETN